MYALLTYTELLSELSRKLIHLFETGKKKNRITRQEKKKKKKLNALLLPSDTIC